MSDVLVDTSIWSLALRHRSNAHANPIVRELEELIRDTRVSMIGPIRQEILSGIKDHKQFELLKNRLRAFPDLDLDEEDFERAAELFNQCRAAGIQGSNTDFLICATANDTTFPSSQRIKILLDIRSTAKSTCTNHRQKNSDLRYNLRMI